MAGLTFHVSRPVDSYGINIPPMAANQPLIAGIFTSSPRSFPPMGNLAGAHVKPNKKPVKSTI
jgi:hypothetical protein